jgi:hypothetical protein
MTEIEELTAKLGDEVARSQEWMRKCELAQKRADAAEADSLVMREALFPFADAYWTGVNGGNETRMLNPIGIEVVAAAKAAIASKAGAAMLDRLRAAEAKAALLDAPEIIDFQRAVVLEAAHQRARWPSDHDAGKTDPDWFWLIGYLAGKALHNPPTPDGRTADELQLHRIITVAAAAANWHAAKLGQTNMRPGIEAPSGEVGEPVSTVANERQVGQLLSKLGAAS